MNNASSSVARSINSSPVLTALAIGAFGAAVVLASTAIYSTSRTNKKTNDDEETNPSAPIGSKFITLPKSEITLRYTDNVSQDESDESKQKEVTFVMLHGFAGCVETWELLIPYLGKNNNRIIALDMVGSGFSDKPIGTNFDYAYRSQGKIVSEFISTLGLSNVVIVGHSSGTVIGAATASASRQRKANDDEKKEAIVIVGAVFMACALLRPKSELFSKWWLKPMFQWASKKMMTNRKQSLAKMHLPVHAERVLTDDFVEKFVAPTRLEHFHDALVKTIMAKEAPYEELVDELLIEPSSDNNKPLPMLFVWGKQDTYKPLPPEQRESIQRKIDAAMTSNAMEPIIEMRELEECHHYPQHEQPEALANEILMFVEKNIKLQQRESCR